MTTDRVPDGVPEWVGLYEQHCAALDEALAALEAAGGPQNVDASSEVGKRIGDLFHAAEVLGDRYADARARENYPEATT